MKARRISLAWSLRETAHRAKVSHAAIDNLEHGRQNVTIGTLEKVASALGIPVEVLVGSESAAETKSEPAPSLGPAGPAAAISARFARIAPHIPEDELDVFIHQVERWERRFAPKKEEG